MRRCYAECCVQTHLLVHIEEGTVERVHEGDKVTFAATAKGRDAAAEGYETRKRANWS